MPTLIFQHLDREEHHKCTASWALELWKGKEEGEESRSGFGFMLRTTFELVL